MEFKEITELDKDKYWWVQGQVVKYFDKDYLATCVAVDLQHVKTMYYITNKNIFGQRVVDFFLDKNEYDQNGNPLSQYIKDKLALLEKYEEFGTIEELRKLLANVHNMLDKKSIENKTSEENAR